jgi:hypothetical protein
VPIQYLSYRVIQFYTSGAIWDPDEISRYAVAAPPYPIYETTEQYINDTWSGKFKGLVSWGAMPSNIFLTIDPDAVDNTVYYSEGGLDFYNNDFGFYVVPNFGNVKVIPNVEYNQTVAIAFDTNSSPDYDPYGSKIIAQINWFINKHKVLIEELNKELELSDGRKVWVMLEGITDPRPTQGSNSSFVRRTITYTLRYCNCS